MYFLSDNIYRVIYQACSLPTIFFHLVMNLFKFWNFPIIFQTHYNGSIIPSTRVPTICIKLDNSFVQISIKMR